MQRELSCHCRLVAIALPGSTGRPPTRATAAATHWLGCFEAAAAVVVVVEVMVAACSMWQAAIEVPQKQTTTIKLATMAAAASDSFTLY